MGFEQALIKVENEREFVELKAAIDKAFAADRVAKFLKTLDGRGIRVRDVDAAIGAVASGDHERFHRDLLADAECRAGIASALGFA